MSRKKYHVTFDKESDQWKGTTEGGKRASVTGSTKAQVQQKTIELAKSQSKSQVIIHKADGKIQSERTYGSDPHPPKG